MPTSATQSHPDSSSSGKSAADSAGAHSKSVAFGLFLTIFENVLVEEPVLHNFDGSFTREHAARFWAWVERDLVTDIDARVAAAVEGGAEPLAAFVRLLPEIQTAARRTLDAAAKNAEIDRRLTVQLGGEEVRLRVPVILTALRCQPLIEKACAFGRATNNMADSQALGQALQAMPVKDPGIAAILMHAAMGHIANPSRLITAVIPLCGNATETSIRSAGFGPLVDAMLAHAQSQLTVLSTANGIFADMDLMCRAIGRYHRLIRAVNGYVEMERNSRWTATIATFTKAASNFIEPSLREINTDVAQSLRRSREAIDRVDTDRLLAALNGVYLLSAVREARDSLALNATFDKVWAETGQTLEVLLNRNLDDLRADPNNRFASQRLDSGIKMAELRFNAEYADILRKARLSAERRAE